MSTTAVQGPRYSSASLSNRRRSFFEDSLRRAFGLDGLPCDTPETPDNLVTLLHNSDAAIVDNGIFMPEWGLRTDGNHREV